MFCWDETSCNERYQSKSFWMSSNGWASQIAQGGIFSDDPSESPFATANLVYVKYCSSDLWLGSVSASPATYNFNFRGFDIIMAVIQSLISDQGMGSGDKLLFGGCSAGAIGAMNGAHAAPGGLAPRRAPAG